MFIASNLTRRRLPVYFFKLGYSLMMRGENPRAMSMFSEIKDIDTDYSAPATYYFAHLAYADKKYLTAMDGFTNYATTNHLVPVVPFILSRFSTCKKITIRYLQWPRDFMSSAGKEREIELY